MPVFRFPFFYNPYYNNFNKSRNPTFSENSQNAHSLKYSAYNNSNQNNIGYDTSHLHTVKKNNEEKNDGNYFFELFGLKLYFDDVLIICLLIFLYQEGNRDTELFLSLVLLLLS